MNTPSSNLWRRQNKNKIYLRLYKCFKDRFENKDETEETPTPENMADQTKRRALEAIQEKETILADLKDKLAAEKEDVSLAKQEMEDISKEQQESDALLEEEKHKKEILYSFNDRNNRVDKTRKL